MLMFANNAVPAMYLGSPMLYSLMFANYIILQIKLNRRNARARINLYVMTDQMHVDKHITHDVCTLSNNMRASNERSAPKKRHANIYA